jgi:hypothetical protein
MKIIQTSNKIITYCISEPDINAPTDETRNINEYFNVSLRGKEIMEIKIPSTQNNFLQSRTLYMLKLLLNQLENEGYKLSYEKSLIE